MYGKLFNRFRKASNNAKSTARSIRTRSLPIASSSNKPLSDVDASAEISDKSSSSYHTYGQDLLDLDSSLEDITSKSFPTTSESASFDPTSPSSTTTILTDENNNQQGTDQYWINVINSQPYKNWLKVGLALRSLCNFLSPLLETIVHEMHSALLSKHGYEEITQNQIARFKQRTGESELLRAWIQDVIKLHRHGLTAGEIFRVSNVIKWPTCDGAWEVARVFMSKGYRTGGDGVNAADFDVSALLNFMYRCRLVDGYVFDFETVKNVLQVRNNIMHNPRLQVDDESLEENFRIIFSLVQDMFLRKHVEKFLSTEKYYSDLNHIKSANFDLMTSAKHSLNVLKDDAFDPRCNLGHPSPRTLVLLKDVLPRILSLPNVEVSADFNKIQSQIANMEEKVAKEYEEAEKKIKEISAHVLHMTQKLDHLRQVLADTKSNGNEPSINIGAKRKRKKDRIDSDSSDTPSTSKNSNSENFCNQTTYKEKHVHFDPRNPLEPSFNGKQSGFDLQDDSVTNVEGSSCSKFQSEIPLVNIDLHPATSAKYGKRLKKIMSQPGLPAVRKKLSERELKISNSRLNMLRNQSSTSLKLNQTCDNNHSELTTETNRQDKLRCKRKRDDDSDNERKNCQNDSSELSSPPRKKGKSRDGDGGNRRDVFCSKLQKFLKKQSNNTGATFTTRMDSDNKYYCSVSFQSYFAVSSPVFASTAKEAKKQAALEASKRILSPPLGLELSKAKIWFDNYAKKKTGKIPNYTCFETSEDSFTSAAHLLNNKLFLLNNSLDSYKIFLEASCTTMNPEIDIEQATIKSALQGTNLNLNNSLEYRKVLNTYCLENGATIPIFHKSSIAYPKSGKMSRSCSLKSFYKKYLSQRFSLTEDDNVEQLDLNEKNSEFNPVFADFLEARSYTPQRSRLLAEECAARGLLQQLSFSDLYLSQIHGFCKAELEAVAEDMDLSIAYHTVKAEKEKKTSASKFSCVVTSPCLDQTKDIFTVTSDGAGHATEDDACESAARNALLLLGMELVFSD